MIDNKKKLLFVEDLNDVSFWGDELKTISKKYDTIALSYGSTILPEYGCSKYYSYSGPKFLLKLKRYVYAFSFFFDKYCIREIGDIWRKKNVNKFICLVKAIRYYAEIRIFGIYIEKNLKSFLENAIVYTYWCDIYTLFFLMNKEKFNISNIVTRMHGYDLYEERRYEGRHPFRWLVNEKIDRIILCGQNNKDYYLKTHKDIDSVKVVIGRLGCRAIENCVDDVKDEFLLVSCSTIKELKRVDLIVEALSTIHDINIRWVHFGKNEIGDSFVELCQRKLESCPNIIFELKGLVTNEIVRGFYSDNYVDAFITTSSTEGAPVSIMEAMAAGIPIIATSVGDIPDMINENGYLLNENPSGNEVRDAIESIARLDDRRVKTMRDNSFMSWNKNYNSKINAHRVVELLENN